MKPIPFSILFLAALTLFACGSNGSSANNNGGDPLGTDSTDDSTSMQFYGAMVAASKSDLPKCDSVVRGQLFYVLADTAFRFCTKSGYVAINLAGVDGVDGNNGAKGATGATGATGTPGADGEDGVDGNSCTVTTSADESKRITCEDGTSYTMVDGTICSVKKVVSGYELTCGTKTVSLADGVDGTDGSNFLSGVTLPPVTLGENGDTYFEAPTQTYYQKENNAWIVLRSATLSEHCNTFGNCGVFDDTRSNTTRTYRWTKIDTLTWMAQNLDYASANSICGEDPTYCEKYGRLYSWMEAKNLACPPDWHLPNSTEWNSLAALSNSGINLRSTSGWLTNTGLDTYGFALLPGGYGEGTTRSQAGEYADLWGYAPLAPAPFYYLGVTGDLFTSSLNIPESNSMSVRCVKD